MPREITGTDVRDAWDWRLSVAQPINFNSGDTWIVRIIANDGSGVLEEHDTGIPTVKDGVRDPHDIEAVTACHTWAKSIRDKYSRPHIELRKPVVAMINAANQRAQELNELAIACQKDGDQIGFFRYSGERDHHIKEASYNIKLATEEMNRLIGGSA